MNESIMPRVVGGWLHLLWQEFRTWRLLCFSGSVVSGGRWVVLRALVLWLTVVNWRSFAVGTSQEMHEAARWLLES